MKSYGYSLIKGVGAICSTGETLLSLILTPEPESVFQSSIGSSTLYLWSCFSSGVIFVLWSCSLLSFHSLSLVNVYPLGFEWVAYGKMSLFLFWGWAQSQDHLVISPHDHHTQHPSNTNMIRSWVKLVWQRIDMHLFCKNVSQIVISYFQLQQWFFLNTCPYLHTMLSKSKSCPASPHRANTTRESTANDP